MPAMLVVDADLSLQYWEYPCQARECDYLYRFTKRGGWLEWDPIDGYTEPDSVRPWSEPVDTLAVVERLMRERLPAA